MSAYPVGAWGGISTLTVVLALYGNSGSGSTILLVGFLLVLLLGGVFLLVRGIIDLVRDLRKSIHSHPLA